ncbi:ShlB/FhaC/HecB family hemolysin secretion/activation protein, partial [Escherichia coli]
MSHEDNMQHRQDNLLVNRTSLPGMSSVRGFKEQYISGNKGGYLRNELSWSLFSLPYV